MLKKVRDVHSAYAGMNANARSEPKKLPANADARRCYVGEPERTWISS